MNRRLKTGQRTTSKPTFEGPTMQRKPLRPYDPPPMHRIHQGTKYKAPLAQSIYTAPMGKAKRGQVLAWFLALAATLALLDSMG